MMDRQSLAHRGQPGLMVKMDNLSRDRRAKAEKQAQLVLRLQWSGHRGFKAVLGQLEQMRNAPGHREVKARLAKPEQQESVCRGQKGLACKVRLEKLELLVLTQQFRDRREMLERLEQQVQMASEYKVQRAVTAKMASL